MPLTKRTIGILTFALISAIGITFAHSATQAAPAAKDDKEGEEIKAPVDKWKVYADEYKKVPYRVEKKDGYTLIHGAHSRFARRMMGTWKIDHLLTADMGEYRGKDMQWHIEPTKEPSAKLIEAIKKLRDACAEKIKEKESPSHKERWVTELYRSVLNGIQRWGTMTTTMKGRARPVQSSPFILSSHQGEHVIILFRDEEKGTLTAGFPNFWPGNNRDLDTFGIADWDETGVVFVRVGGEETRKANRKKYGLELDLESKRNRSDDDDDKTADDSSKTE